ncbi:MAG: toll/interleukin-1 receptor domain-containing protein [ANME-2 cluster archaeon]|nr:MAG: toll/interleukin-1 receptor domain-containing protein [ANME-2 cluster archaeon]
MLKEPIVFLSYAREDELYAKKIFNNLKKNGVEVWADFDNASLPPGSKWEPAIKTSIKKSSYFLAILSSKSVTKKGFFQKELVIALNIVDEFPEQDIFIIPVRLDECYPSHEKLKEFSWVDMFPSWDDGINKILSTVKSPVDFPNKVKKKTPPKMIPIIILLILVLVIIYLLFFYPTIKSEVSVDDYACPLWIINSEVLQDPAKDKSIKWDYEIDCKSQRLCYATINLDFDKEYDISDYIGISFAVKGNKAINEINSENTPLLEFLLHINKDREYIYWSGKNNKNMEISDKWMNKTILFSHLKIAHWTNDSKASSEPNLKKVYALNFAVPTSTQRSNVIWIHDIKLIHKDGNMTSLVTGNVPILFPEEPIRGKWSTPYHAPKLEMDKGI